MLMQKRVALILCRCVDEPIGPVAMDGVILRKVLHLINEHVKWQSDKEIFVWLIASCNSASRSFD